MIDRNYVMSSARFAGQVERYHTWPTWRQQSIAEHTWQCIRIHYQVWGAPTGKALDYLVWHDTGELATGDMPFPVKAHNPLLKVEADRIENLQRERLGAPNIDDLSDADKLRVKFCDLVEMTEFGLSEINLGNKYAQCIYDDTLAAAQKLTYSMSSEDSNLARSFLEKIK